MSRRIKLVIGASGAAFIVLLAPFAWSGFGARGYFDGGRCACGNNIFIHLKAEGYYTYSPGHGMPEEQNYALQRKGQEWELLALPSATLGWVSTPRVGEVVGRIRLERGALYVALGGSTNWTRYARIYNPVPIWMARALNQ